LSKIGGSERLSFETQSHHLIKKIIMKYICLGFMESGKFENWSESERNSFVDSCFAYDEWLRKNGHFLSGEGLQGATTLRWRNGKVAVTDGPFAETKEQIGGLIVLEARDLNHAIQLMSKHPGVRGGPWQIHPVADLSGLVRDSEHRRAKARDDAAP
jgi:hypothetical protein